MNTFLPIPECFESCAKVLDFRRLGKQRVEALQVHRALHNTSYGWQWHPAVEMWRGYERALKYYFNCMLAEWVDRGYNNTMQPFYLCDRKIEFPPWLRVPLLRITHRANLVRKEPEHYLAFGWKHFTLEKYWWPYERVNGEWVRNFWVGRNGALRIKYFKHWNTARNFG